MAENYAVPKSLIPPLPETLRGYGIHIDLHKKEKKLLYCNGNCVVIRSLENLLSAELFTEHKTHVHVAKFSPNGEWVASGDDHGRVLVWSLKTKTLKNTVQVCRKVLDIAWSDDGQRIVAVGDGSEAFAKVFAWDSGNTFGDIAGHSKQLLSVAWKPSRPFKIVTVAEDNSVIFHAGPPFKYDHSFTEHTRFPNCVRYSPDGTQFATAGADSKIFLFDGTTGQKIKEIESKDAHKGSIYSLSWSPDGKQILTASGDKTAKVWSVADNSCVTTYTFGTEIDDMQVSTAWDANFMVTVSLSGAINILDPANPAKPKLVIQGHQAPIRSFQLDAANKTLYTADQNGMLAHWDLNTGFAQWMEGKGHGKGIVGIGISSTAESVITIGMDDKLRLNDAKTNHFSANATDLGGLPTSIGTLHKSPDTYVVSIAQGKIVIVKKGNIVSSFDVKYRPNVVAVSPDDVEVAVGGEDKKVHLYALSGDTLKETKTLAEHDGSVDTVSYSQSGTYLASADKGRYIQIWERNGDAPKNAFGWRFHTAKVTTVSWNPSGNKVASGSQDQNIIVWSDADGFSGDKRLKLEYAHAEGVLFAQFLDDNTLISAGNDRAIKIWDATL